MTQSTLTANLHLVHPFTFIIAGGSQCGKTHFTTKIIQNIDGFIKPQLKTVLILYKEMQPGYELMMKADPRVKLFKGLDLEGVQPNTLIIIDDQMSDSMKDKEVQELFTSGVHHKSISVIFLTQNLYCQGKFS